MDGRTDRRWHTTALKKAAPAPCSRPAPAPRPLSPPRASCCSGRGQDSGLAPGGSRARATEAHKDSRARASLRCWCGYRAPRVLREPRRGRQSSPGIRGFVTAASPGFQPHQAENQTRGSRCRPLPGAGTRTWCLATCPTPSFPVAWGWVQLLPIPSPGRG